MHHDFRYSKDSDIPMTYRRIYSHMRGLHVEKHHSRVFRGIYKWILLSRRVAPKLGCKYDDIGERGPGRNIRKLRPWRMQ